ncbi:hypothetical protein GDO78_000870 [Eleutherodactylus coqui]|uniref:Uncharacterized protein n=1 Tax=Eleutherodactylus coqui TaxID=57060 RepID=A0A8J6FR67_ELECQ|nr:hypothetical protein GDO78_000870 [Eleutherodactylus coqui]
MDFNSHIFFLNSHVRVGSSVESNVYKTQLTGITRFWCFTHIFYLNCLLIATIIHLNDMQQPKLKKWLLGVKSIF